MTRRKNKQERIQDSYNDIKRIRDKLGRYPEVKEYEAMRINGYDRRTLERNSGMKYNEILHRVFGKISPVYITKEDVIENIDIFINENNRVPKLNELLNLFGLTEDSQKQLRKYAMGNMTYNDFILSLGLEPTKRYSSNTNEQYMLDNFMILFNKLGRIPSATEIDEHKAIASSSTYLNKFGSLKNICDKLNISYSKNYFNKRNFGKICFDINGDLCLSMQEKRITDFLILNNIKYDKEVKYGKILNTDDNRRFDWVVYVNNDTYPVENFGLYHDNPKDQYEEKYHNKTISKINTLKCNDVYKNCIFIFPKDLKTKSLEEIFKKIL